jgi:hypothetical protein
MKNKLLDLNNHLFAQLERLNEENLSPDDLEREISRADAIAKVSGQIIETANTALKAAKLVADYSGNIDGMLPMIDGEVPARKQLKGEDKK